MLRTRALLGLTVVAVVVALLSAPARLIGLFVPTEQLLVTGFSGTVWNGSASRCLLAVPGGYLHLGAITWRLQPLSLVFMAPRLHLVSDWGRQQLAGDIIIRGDEDLSLSDFEARFSAGLLQQFAPISLSGEISAQVASLNFSSSMLAQAEGRLVWQRGAWLSPQGSLPLGSYALDFIQAEGDPLAGEVVTLVGPVTAEGRVGLDGNRYSLAIDIASEGAMHPALQQALSLMARPVDDGYRLELVGEL